MKKLLLTALFLFCFASLASAEVIKFSKFSLDVPAGYNYKENEDGVFVSNEENSAVATVSILPSEGLSGADIANALAQELGGSKPEAQGEGFAFMFKDDEFGESLAIVIAQGNIFMFMTVLGEDMKLLDMLGTMK